MNRYTNIRYHIYKELSKYRRLQEKRRADRVNEIAIPILTGIVVVLITNWLILRFHEICGLYYFLLIFIISVGFWIILLMIKSIYDCWENKIRPNLFPIIRISPEDKEFSPIQEDDAAKFNYEVTYLVESAYSQVQRIEVLDEFLFNFSLLNILFSIKNALRKMNESLLGRSGKLNNGLVSYSMIKVVLEMISTTLSRIQSYDKNKTERYSDDIEFIIGLYDDIRRQIQLEYEI